MTTVIRNQGTSAEVRRRLAEEGRPVLLAFSCGKDSIAAWCAMRDEGIDVVPAYLYYVPGLTWINEELDYFEQKFGTRIRRYPHPSLYRWLNNFVYQAPERLRYIEAAQLPTPTYEQTWDLIRDHLGLPKDTWCADGVRAADSIQRRGAFVRYGYWRHSSRKVSHGLHRISWPQTAGRLQVVRKVVRRHRPSVHRSAQTARPRRLRGAAQLVPAPGGRSCPLNHWNSAAA